MSSSGSEEDMPEAISFKESKVEHENFDNQVKDFLKEQRNALKDKRRRKQEVLESLKKEKEDKLKRKLQDKSAQSSEEEGKAQQQKQLLLEKRLLPIEVLAALKSDVPSSISENREKADDDKSSDDDDETGPAVRVRPKKMRRKVNDKLNIRVEALPQLESRRAAAAVDFRNKRFAKVHRESVDKNRIHQEKLIASGQHILRHE